jgi:quercetin dioxygenase-like cupin family protein
MIALATIGLRVLFVALAWFGVSMAAHQAAIGAVIMGLIAIGILVSVLGAILLLARTGSGKATWLIGSGLVLLVLGSGPLAFAVLTAADRNPNPVFEGMLAGVTFMPAIVAWWCWPIICWDGGHLDGTKQRSRGATSRRAVALIFAVCRAKSWRDNNKLGGADVEIRKSGSVPTRRGPADSFTGTVWQDPVIEAPAPARIRASRVHFEPGARTAWHTHPLGQTLHVIFGVGRVQSWGGPVREIRAGDTVWFPPDEKHWHGAAPRMVHLAFQESLDGKHVTWMEHVTDEQYRVEPTA